MRVRRLAAAACLLGLALPAVTLPDPVTRPASAQETQEEARQRVDQAVSQAREDLEHSSAQVRAAAAALAEVAAQLPVAKQDAVQARGELDGARARAGAALAAARRAELATQAAQREVDEASAQVEQGRAAVAQLARRSYQQGPLGDLRTILAGGSPQDLIDRSTTLERVFRAQNDSLHGLRRDRLALATTERELELVQQALDEARRQADEDERRARLVAQRADQAAARVAALVTRRNSALRSAERERAADVADYQQAQAASRALAERIRRAALLARQAEARRRAAAAAALARQRAAAAAGRRAEAAAAAAAARAARPPQPSAGGMQWPANGPLTSRYGARRHPIFGDVRFHAGIDIGVPYGAPVVSADDGTVTYAGPASGYGTLVLVSHGVVGGRDVTSAYAHQSAILVRTGQQVSRGQQVGRVGSEGNSTGPHLHFEIRLDGEPTDPLGWVSPP